MKRERSMRRRPRRAVYTALIGDYEPLADQITAHASDVDFICFTDVPDLVSDTWQIRRITPVLPEDPIRSARQLKICGHPELGGYHQTLWIDARVVLDADPAEILDVWLADAAVAVPRHSFRDSVAGEFDEIIKLGIDDRARVEEQLAHYTREGAERLSADVPWTGMIARRADPAVDAAMDEWMRHVWRYSRRDQLSFVEALARRGVRHRLIDIDNLQSDWHRWPRRPAEHPSSVLPQPRTSELV